MVLQYSIAAQLVHCFGDGDTVMRSQKHKAFLFIQFVALPVFEIIEIFFSSLGEFCVARLRYVWKIPMNSLVFRINPYKWFQLYNIFLYCSSWARSYLILPNISRDLQIIFVAFSQKLWKNSQILAAVKPFASYWMPIVKKWSVLACCFLPSKLKCDFQQFESLLNIGRIAKLP